MRSIYLSVYVNNMGELARLGLTGGRVVKSKSWEKQHWEYALWEMERELWSDDANKVRREVGLLAQKIRGLIRRYRFVDCCVEVEEGDTSGLEYCYDGPSDADPGL